MATPVRPSCEIDGKGRTVRELLAGRKYSIDHYQRFAMTAFSLRPRRFLRVTAGARQVDKTMLVEQVCRDTGLPMRFASAEEPALLRRLFKRRRADRGRPRTCPV